MNILSIDWSYFINASASYRYSMFPDKETENINSHTPNMDWIFKYAQLDAVKTDCKSLLEVDADHDEIQKLLNLTTLHKKINTKLVVCESHSGIADIIQS